MKDIKFLPSCSFVSTFYRLVFDLTLNTCILVLCALFFLISSIKYYIKNATFHQYFSLLQFFFPSDVHNKHVVKDLNCMEKKGSGAPNYINNMDARKKECVLRNKKVHDFVCLFHAIIRFVALYLCVLFLSISFFFCSSSSLGVSY